LSHCQPVPCQAGAAVLPRRLRLGHRGAGLAAHKSLEGAIKGIWCRWTTFGRLAVKLAPFIMAVLVEVADSVVPLRYCPMRGTAGIWCRNGVSRLRTPDRGVVAVAHVGRRQQGPVRSARTGGTRSCASEKARSNAATSATARSASASGQAGVSSGAPSIISEIATAAPPGRQHSGGICTGLR